MSDDVINDGMTAQDNTNADDTTVETLTATGEETEPTTTEPDNGLPGGDESADDSLPGGEDDAGQSDDSDSDAEDSGNELKGAPEEYAPFDFSAGEDIGYTMTEDQTKAFTEFGKEHNLDDKQMAGILNFDIARQKATLEANNKYIEQQKAEGIKAARQKYGEKYAAMHKKNGAIYNKFFNEETRTLLNDFGISSNAGFFEALSNISAVLSEDVTVPGDSGAADPSKRTLEDYFKDKPL